MIEPQFFFIVFERNYKIITSQNHFVVKIIQGSINQPHIRNKI